MTIGPAHRRRLQEVYRSAGWSFQDGLEIELLAAGLLQRVRSPLGHETLRLSDAGLCEAAAGLRHNRTRRDDHEALVAQVARELTRHGRLTWRALRVRAKVQDAWALSAPDVLSIRHTSAPHRLEPMIHELTSSPPLALWAAACAVRKEIPAAMVLLSVLIPTPSLRWVPVLQRLRPLRLRARVV